MLRNINLLTFNLHKNFKKIDLKYKFELSKIYKVIKNTLEICSIKKFLRNPKILKNLNLINKF